MARIGRIASRASAGVCLVAMGRGINIISQYGQFDLLRKQDPNEALRLGVK